MKDTSQSTRWAALLGALGAAGYATGDSLLFAGRIDPIKHPVLARDETDDLAGVMVSVPSSRLLAGALAGVFATPLYVFGIASLVKRLSPANRPVPRIALGTGGVLLAANMLSPFIHGTFFAYGETAKRADEAIARGDFDDTVSGLLAQLKRVEQAIFIPYAAHAGLLVGAGLMAGWQVATGRTTFPRWAAPLVTPAVPIAAALAVTMSLPMRPEPVKHAVRGASISLGVLGSYLAVAFLPTRMR